METGVFSFLALKEASVLRGIELQVGVERSRKSELLREGIGQGQQIFALMFISITSLLHE